MSRFVVRILRVAALAWVASRAGVARAQALSAPNVGTSDAGPVTVDPAAVHWNPANLADLDVPTTLVGLDLIVGDIRYTRERRATYQREDSLQFRVPIAPTSVDPSKTGKADAVRSTPFGPSPSGFVALPLAKGLVAGLGAYAPYAAIVSFDDDGPQRWALQRATIGALFVTPAIGYRLTDWLSIGAGVSYVLGFVDMAKVQDFAAVQSVGEALARRPIEQRNDFGPAAPPAVRELSAMARPIRLQKMVGHGATFHVGAALTPTDALRVGVSYQHGVDLKVNGSFSLDMNDDFFTQDLASQGLAFQRRVEGDATLVLPLPHAVHAGVSYRVADAWSAALTGSYTGWSRVRSFEVYARSPALAQPKLGIPDTTQISLPRAWQDTVLVMGTVRHRLSSATRLWASGGWHSAAVPDATLDAASPDGASIVAAVGVGHAVTPHTTLLADFKLRHMLPRTVVGSDFDLGNGSYALDIYTLGLHAQTAF